MELTNMAAKLFADYLDKKGTKYSKYDNETIEVILKGENTSVRLLFIFDDDTRSVGIKVWNIVKIPEEKVGNACFVCSKLNGEYRWVKFSLDSENNLDAVTDAIITPSTVGEVCHELLHRVARIVDKAYPLIMKTVWS